MRIRISMGLKNIYKIKIHSVQNMFELIQTIFTFFNDLL